MEDTGDARRSYGNPRRRAVVTEVRMAGRAGAETLSLAINIGLGRQEFKLSCAIIHEPPCAADRLSRAPFRTHSR
jgi:hypothetical protein